jgi:hypothetical protein
VLLDDCPSLLGGLRLLILGLCDDNGAFVVETASS